MAPETVLRKLQSFEVDYFSIGILTHELLFGDIPFQGDNFNQAKEMFISQEIKIKIDSSFGYASSEALDFMLNLIKRKPKERLGHWEGIKELKRHKWFSGFNWNALKHFKLKAPFIPNSDENFPPGLFDKLTDQKKLNNNQNNYTAKELSELKQVKFQNFTFIKNNFEKEEEKNPDDEENNEYHIEGYGYQQKHKQQSEESLLNNRFKTKHKKIKTFKLGSKNKHYILSRNLSQSSSSTKFSESSKCNLPAINTNKSCILSQGDIHLPIKVPRTKTSNEHKVQHISRNEEIAYSLHKKDKLNPFTPPLFKSNFFHFDILKQKPIPSPDKSYNECKENNLSCHPHIYESTNISRICSMKKGQITSYASPLKNRKIILKKLSCSEKKNPLY